MVREVKVSWDVDDGELEPPAHRDSVFDEDLLFVNPVRSRRRATNAKRRVANADRRAASRSPSTVRRHLAGAAWTTGELHKRVRHDE